jgi:GWxTD domain-containing protein
MTSLLITQYSSDVMIFLVDAAVRSIVLALLAALVLAGLRVRQVTVYLTVWTGVLYAASAMPLLAWIMPAISLRVPVHLIAASTPNLTSGQIRGQEERAAAECERRSGRCPSPEPTWYPLGTAPARGQSVVDGRLSGARASVRTGKGPRSTTGALAASQVGGKDGAAGKLLQLAPKLAMEVRSALARLPRIASPARILAIYILGLAFLLGRLITGFFLARRLRRSFRRVNDPRAWQWVERDAGTMGLKRAPSLAESGAVKVPLTVGVFHPVIVIPSGWREWPSAKLAAVIAHEVSHVRRNDSRTRAAALVYRCFFWFSPLGWWLERRLADLAEQASDEAAIRAGAEPTEYAQVLMSFFDISTRQGRVSLHGVSMARGLRARKRIEQVLAAGGALPAAMKTPILVLLALCALPIVWLTAATRPVLVAGFDSIASKPVTQNFAHLHLLPPVPAGPKISPLARAAASELPLLAPTAPLKGSSFPDEKTGMQQTRPQAATQGDSSGFYPWLKSPIAYIATEEERPAFRRLTTDEGREQFIEQFWERPQKASRQGMETPYKKWLSEEVPYIITDAERATFKKFATDVEREAFIEYFWERRNPNPGSPENEFKEEYYRRIAYANEHYASGIPGWKTDRGRIYIMWGPPDEIDSHPSGGTYERPDSEGGGETSTFPFEQWRYRYIDGIGYNIILEFVDTTMTGEYHLTMDPGEKDYLLRVPGAGRATADSSLQSPSTPPRLEDPPITMGIVIGSPRVKWPGVTTAVFPLVEASKPHDEVCIVNSGGSPCVMDFNDKGCSVNLNVKDEAFNRLPYGDHFTSDIREMEQALARTDSWSGWGMRGGAWMAIDQIEQIPQNERRVLVLIADGIDTYSKVTQEELLAKVRNSGVRVYCIGLLGLPTSLQPLKDLSRMKYLRQVGAARLALGQLAEASGGLAYYPKDLAEVERISAEIANEVRKQ